ncbi:hypothetical protein BU26DRAFT_522622 [Trematosphaeria pertusa]|uniref:Uncharacterized protein n=1 Tax=Trematosphaeria pertusa TaxID=390896 RepID=A0A6A6I3Q2_9PLEO|nr:uncharacterized protein BU26DRAFT_522622 [Trematosphaeria pertusa]KAF2244896.1 hypothetical protein BU26DRAFT_522622 [Trematosphaeria pertusa]
MPPKPNVDLLLDDGTGLRSEDVPVGSIIKNPHDPRGSVILNNHIPPQDLRHSQQSDYERTFKEQSYVRGVKFSESIRIRADQCTQWRTSNAAHHLHNAWRNSSDNASIAEHRLEAFIEDRRLYFISGFEAMNGVLVERIRKSKGFAPISKDFPDVRSISQISSTHRTEIVSGLYLIPLRFIGKQDVKFERAEEFSMLAALVEPKIILEAE